VFRAYSDSVLHCLVVIPIADTVIKQEEWLMATVIHTLKF